MSVPDKANQIIGSSALPDELTVEQLAQLCPPDTLPFATTNELPDLQDVVRIRKAHSTRRLSPG